MKRSLLAAVAIAASFMINAAHASVEELPDYSDAKKYSCADTNAIEAELSELIKQSQRGTSMGLRLIYVKGTPVEVSRAKDELRCRVVAVTTQATIKGTFRLFNQDGHALSGFRFDPN